MHWIVRWIIEMIVMQMVADNLKSKISRLWDFDSLTLSLFPLPGLLAFLCTIYPPVFQSLLCTAYILAEELTNVNNIKTCDNQRI